MNLYRIFIILILCSLSFRVYAYDTEVLPQGVHLFDFQYRHFSCAPNAVSISGLEELTGLDLKSLSFGYVPQEILDIGKIELDLDVSVNVLVLGWAYGILDNLTAAIYLPIFLSAQIDIETFSANTGPVGYNNKYNPYGFDLPSQTPITTTFLSNDVSGNEEGVKKIVNNYYQYEPLENQKMSGIGDIGFGGLWKAYHQDFFSLAMLALVFAPTGKKDNPHNLMDFGLGDGQWDTGLFLTNNFNIKDFFHLIITPNYTIQWPYQPTMRIYTSESIPLAKKDTLQKVTYNKGDKYGIEIALKRNITSWLTLAAKYSKDFYGAAKIYDNAKNRMPIMEKFNGLPYNSNTYGLELTVSTIEMFLQKQFSIPFIIHFELVQIQASNPLNNGMQTMASFALPYK